jgi:thioredoxin 1
VKKSPRRSITALVLALLLAGCTKTESVSTHEDAPAGAQLVTFVELGSVGCTPCRMMQPIMREIAAEYRGQVSVVFHDVWTDAGKPYVKKYGIRVIPTQVFLDARGVEYFRHEGFFPKEQLIEALKAKGVK